MWLREAFKDSVRRFQKPKYSDSAEPPAEKPLGFFACQVAELKPAQIRGQGSGAADVRRDKAQEP